VTYRLTNHPIRCNHPQSAHTLPAVRCKEIETVIADAGEVGDRVILRGEPNDQCDLGRTPGNMGQLMAKVSPGEADHPAEGVGKVGHAVPYHRHQNR